MKKISSGIKFNGIEHFLPLLHQNNLSSILDFINYKNVIILKTKNFSNLISKRDEEILNFSDDRKLDNEDFKVVKVEDLYLTKTQLEDQFKNFKTIEFNELDVLKKEMNYLNFNSKPFIIDHFVKDLDHSNKIKNIIKFLSMNIITEKNF